MRLSPSVVFEATRRESVVGDDLCGNANVHKRAHTGSVMHGEIPREGGFELTWSLASRRKARPRTAGVSRSFCGSRVCQAPLNFPPHNDQGVPRSSRSLRCFAGELCDIATWE
jgi:hypothetical protein